MLQHGVDLAGLDFLGGGVGWIRVGLATNDQYIGINTWRRRICLRTPTSSSSTLCFSPAWLVGGCTMHIIVCITSSNILSSEMPPRRNHPNIFHSLLCPVINCTGICDRSQLDSSSAPSSTAASGEHDPHGHIPANKALSVEV